jgi:hypothetical protein
MVMDGVTEIAVETVMETAGVIAGETNSIK